MKQQSPIISLLSIITMAFMIFMPRGVDGKKASSRIHTGPKVPHSVIVEARKASRMLVDPIILSDLHSRLASAQSPIGGITSPNHPPRSFLIGNKKYYLFYRDHRPYIVFFIGAIPYHFVGDYWQPWPGFWSYWPWWWAFGFGAAGYYGYGCAIDGDCYADRILAKQIS